MLWDDMYSMSSTPLTASSSGAATVSASTCGFAPGNCVRTWTDGGTTSGYSDTGRRSIARTPAMKMKMETTDAKIGRSMKKRERSMTRGSAGYFLSAAAAGRAPGAGVSGVTATGCPGRTRIRPFTITCSPGLSPSTITRWPSTTWAVCTAR